MEKFLAENKLTRNSVQRSQLNEEMESDELVQVVNQHCNGKPCKFLTQGYSVLFDPADLDEPVYVDGVPASELDDSVLSKLIMAIRDGRTSR